MTGLHLLLLFGESTITAANKYSAFGCISGYKSKGGEQGQNSPFTLIQFMTRICVLNGWKLILAKTVPCAVTVYTCSSYYRRSIRTSLSSLQSHVLTSLWSNSYNRREDWWNGAIGFRWSLHRWWETKSFRYFRACLLLSIVHTLTHEVRRMKVQRPLSYPSHIVNERMDSNTFVRGRKSTSDPLVFFITSMDPLAVLYGVPQGSVLGA